MTIIVIKVRDGVNTDYHERSEATIMALAFRNTVLRLIRDGTLLFSGVMRRYASVSATW